MPTPLCGHRAIRFAVTLTLISAVVVAVHSLPASAAPGYVITTDRPVAYVQETPSVNARTLMEVPNGRGIDDLICSVPGDPAGVAPYPNNATWDKVNIGGVVGFVSDMRVNTNGTGPKRDLPNGGYYYPTAGIPECSQASAPIAAQVTTPPTSYPYPLVPVPNLPDVTQKPSVIFKAEGEVVCLGKQRTCGRSLDRGRDTVWLGDVHSGITQQRFVHEEFREFDDLQDHRRVWWNPAEMGFDQFVHIALSSLAGYNSDLVVRPGSMHWFRPQRVTGTVTATTRSQIVAGPLSLVPFRAARANGSSLSRRWVRGGQLGTFQDWTHPG